MILSLSISYKLKAFTLLNVFFYIRLKTLPRLSIYQPSVSKVLCISKSLLKVPVFIPSFSALFRFLFRDKLPLLKFPILVFDHLEKAFKLRFFDNCLRGKAGIYLFLNNKSGNFYIGSSRNIAQRFSYHFRGKSSNIPLQSAISKYGISQFSFVVLEFIDPVKPLEEILAKEQYYLDLLKPSYNLQKTVRAYRQKFNQSWEIRQFLRERMKNFKHTSKTRQKMSDNRKGSDGPFSGKTHSEEVKANFSFAYRGEKHHHYGKKQSLATIRKIRQGRGGKRFLKDYEGEEPSPEDAVAICVVVRNSSLTMVAKALNIDRKTVKRYISDNIPFKGKYLLNYKYPRGESIGKAVTPLEPSFSKEPWRPLSGALSIIVRDALDGFTVEYSSLGLAARLLNIHRKTIQRYLKNKQSFKGKYFYYKGTYSGAVEKVISTDPSVVNDTQPSVIVSIPPRRSRRKQHPETIEKIRKAQLGKRHSPETIEKIRRSARDLKPGLAVAIGVIVRNLIEGTVVEYPSISAAASALNVNRKTVQRYIEKGKPFQEKYFISFKNPKNL